LLLFLTSNNCCVRMSMEDFKGIGKLSVNVE
jgi:hypothetical protein